MEKPQESCKRMTSCMTSCISRHRSVDIRSSDAVWSNSLTVSSPVASPTFCGSGSLGKCCNCLPWSWSSLEHVGLENWMNSMNRRVSRWISVQYVKLGRFGNYSLTWSNMAKMLQPEGGFQLNTSKHFEWSWPYTRLDDRKHLPKKDWKV